MGSSTVVPCELERAWKWQLAVMEGIHSLDGNEKAIFFHLPPRQSKQISLHILLAVIITRYVIFYFLMHQMHVTSNTQTKWK